jgi:tagatose 6-phosphate kinase
MRALTVTVNTAVDTTYVLDRLTLGAINRVARALPAPGGKGNNVARVLTTLGHEVVATGFAGGYTGRFIADRLRALGIEPALVPVADESRICLTVVEEATGRITEIREPGVTVGGEDAARLLVRASELATGTDTVVVSGSLAPGLPPDFYAGLVNALRATDTFIALDTSGEALRLGLGGQPDLIKPNAEELAELLGAEAGARPSGGAGARPCAPTSASLIEAARDGLPAIGLAGDATVLLSLGGDGAALIRNGGAYHAVPPAVDVVNTVGCGDALLAGYVDARARNATDTDALAHAVAVGTAAALHEAVGVVSVDDIARLRPEVRVREMTT